MSLLANLYAGTNYVYSVNDNDFLEARLTSERKDPNSQESLFLKACGLMYGKCIKKDLNLAFQLFKQLSDQGLIAAKYHLGCLLLDGDGIEKNHNQAFMLTTQAAEAGHFMAISNKILLN